MAILQAQNVMGSLWVNNTDTHMAGASTQSAIVFTRKIRMGGNPGNNLANASILCFVSFHLRNESH